MADPKKIKEIRDAISLPVMAKCRIGHFVEAQVLQALDVDFIDESEVLSRADDKHIEKSPFKVPFVCGCTNLPQALRRLTEGATMIRTKGEAGTGDVLQAVLHVRKLQDEIEQLRSLNDAELHQYALDNKADFEIVSKTAKLGRLPAVTFAAGGVATPSDAALLMQLGVDGVFVGSVYYSYQVTNL